MLFHLHGWARVAWGAVSVFWWLWLLTACPVLAQTGSGSPAAAIPKAGAAAAADPSATAQAKEHAAAKPAPAKPALAKPAPAKQEPAKQEPAPGSPEKEEAESDSEGDAADEAQTEDAGGEEPPAVAKPRAQGNSLARQTASVQRQLGRVRPQSGFFISSWFSDAPAAANFASGATVASMSPEDCDPIDASVAEAYIRDSARREGISSDLVREVVRKESGFNPCAVSPKGAMGMMQLMPETAASLGVDDPFNPRQNIDGGVRLLKRLLDKYKGRPDLALAAYNAGESAVDAAQSVPSYEETQEYVSTIMKRVFEEPSKPARPIEGRPGGIRSPDAVKGPEFVKGPESITPSGLVPPVKPATGP